MPQTFPTIAQTPTAIDTAAPITSSARNARSRLTPEVLPKLTTMEPEIGGVSGLIVRDGRVLLIKRGKEPFKGFWSLPGGGVEPGETLRAAVRREVLEETGFEVEVGRVAGYREWFEPLHHVILAFHVEVTGGEMCAGDDATACEFVQAEEILRRQVTPGLEDVFRDAGLL